MLYSNKELTCSERILDFGTIYQVGMGEIGRGRKFMALTCPKNTVIKRGMNSEFTISTTKSGRPRINKNSDKKLYLLLSAEGGYTRRGNGTIQVLEAQKEHFHVLARGNGADGAAGRIGFWDCMLLETPLTDCIVRVRTSGAGYGTPSDLYVIHESLVYHCHPADLENCCEALGIPVPCQLTDTVNGICLGDDWVIL